MNKEDFDIIIKEVRNMTDAEFDAAMDEAECGDLRWALEYAWNPQLDEFAQWKVCFKHMWE